MATNDELPPIGLPPTGTSSSRYFFGIIAMVIGCGAAVFGIGYAAFHLSRGPCDERYGDLVAGLRSEVDFFRDSGTALGVSSVAIHELRTSTRLTEESLVACCEQLERATDGDAIRECDEHATVIADLRAELEETHDDPATAKKRIGFAAISLRGVADDLTRIADRSDPAAPADAAASPASDTGGDR